jgi:hypothetical protein
MHLLHQLISSAAIFLPGGAPAQRALNLRELCLSRILMPWTRARGSAGQCESEANPNDRGVRTRTRLKRNVNEKTWRHQQTWAA